VAERIKLALVALRVGESGESHSPSHRRAECSLVALRPSPDLFNPAIDLLIEDMTGPMFL
jgi:hypothetical protein